MHRGARGLRATWSDLSRRANAAPDRGNRRQRKSPERLIVRVVIAVTAALLLLAAGLAGRMAILWAETQRFEASSVCLAGGGDGCRALHGGVVVGSRETAGRGSTRYVSVRLPDRRDAVYDATVFVDYGLFDSLTVGLPIGVEEWHGDVTRLFRGDRFLLTKDSLESRFDYSFYMMFLLVLLVLLVGRIVGVLLGW